MGTGRGRRSPRCLRGRRLADDQAGFTLVEAMVGLLLIAVGLLALLTELTTYIRTQGAERSQAQAVRVLSSTVEDARNLTATDLRALAGPPVTVTAASSNKTTYRLTTDLRVCSLADAPTQCTTPTAAATADTRLVATVQWSYGGKARSLSTSTSIADRSSTPYRPSGTGTLGGLLGGTDRASTTVAVQTISASPAPSSVTAAGVTTAPVVLSLSTVGLSSSTTTSIPVTWVDDRGSHQASFVGGPSSWTATIPAGGITRAPAAGQVSSSVTFTALVPGAPGFTKTTLALTSKPAFVSCQVSTNPFVLGLLTNRLAEDETFTCTTTGLRPTDPVRITYNGSTQKAMTSTDGSTWRVVLPKGTQMTGLLGLVSTVTFDASRDGVPAAQKSLLVTAVTSL